MSASFQELYDSIEEELRKDKAWTGHAQRRPSVDEEIGESAAEQPIEPSSEHDIVEQRVEEVMELVEACITIVFYDR